MRTISNANQALATMLCTSTPRAPQVADGNQHGRGNSAGPQPGQLASTSGTINKGRLSITPDAFHHGPSSEDGHRSSAPQAAGSEEPTHREHTPASTKSFASAPRTLSLGRPGYDSRQQGNKITDLSRRVRWHFESLFTDPRHPATAPYADTVNALVVVELGIVFGSDGDGGTCLETYAIATGATRVR